MYNFLFTVLACVLLALRNLAEQLLALDDQTFFTTLTHLLVLLTTSRGLFAELFGAEILGLLLENVLHQSALVLESVTLSLQVEIVVQVLVDLLGITVLLQQITQDSDTAHPQDFLRHSGISGTTTLTESSVTTFATGLSFDASTEARVDLSWLLDDQTVLDQTSDVLTRVGV